MANSSLLRKRKQPPSLSDDENEVEETVEDGDDNEMQKTFQYYTPPKKRPRLKNNHKQKINLLQNHDFESYSEDNETDDQEESSSISENEDNTNGTSSTNNTELNNITDVELDNEQEESSVEDNNSPQDDTPPNTTDTNVSTSSWTDKIKSAWFSWTGGIRSSSSDSSTSTSNPEETISDESNTSNKRTTTETTETINKNKTNTNNSTSVISKISKKQRKDNTRDTNHNNEVVQDKNHSSTKSQVTLNESPELESAVITTKRKRNHYEKDDTTESPENIVPQEVLEEFSTPGKSKITTSISRRDSGNTSLNTSLSSLSPNSSFQSDTSTTSNSRRQSSYKLRSMSFSLAQVPEQRRSNLNTSSSFVSPREPPLTPRKSSSSFRSPLPSDSPRTTSQQRNYVPSDNASINSLPAASIPITSPRRRSSISRKKKQRNQHQQSDLNSSILSSSSSSSLMPKEERRLSINRRRSSRRLSSRMNQDVSPVKFDNVSIKKKPSTPSSSKMEQKLRKHKTQSYIRQRERLSTSMSQL
eukprot:gb/GECH01001873.1/.p1 GENE.gb/GECH01001873.1/~~gb/GECH01001873.1/.p1  ORF type:complete len:530 (+),score=182.08 gb/GECH01001873.1/:1-1590(+)